jgi:DNA mismatch repair ATPase MutL
MSLHVLDAKSRYRICSGQAITCASGVVKELLENAIDAGAQSVRITLEDDVNITVADNGCGLAPADVTLFGAASCTSKISSFEDVARTTTLGFRGEAVNVRGAA